MSALEAPGVLDRLALASPQQRALRAVVLLSGLVFLGLVAVAGGTLTPVFVVPAVVLAVLAALAPESNLPLGLVLGLAVVWLRAMPDHVDGWALAAAVDLAVLHLACTLAGFGPPGVRLDGLLLRRWGGRLVLCAAAATLTWVTAEVVAFLDVPPSRLLLAAALVVLLAWAAFLAALLAHGRPD